MMSLFAVLLKIDVLRYNTNFDGELIYYIF